MTLPLWLLLSAACSRRTCETTPTLPAPPPIVVAAPVLPPCGVPPAPAPVGAEEYGRWLPAEKIVALAKQLAAFQARDRAWQACEAMRASGGVPSATESATSSSP
jgi:hypothetical protein